MSICRAVVADARIWRPAESIVAVLCADCLGRCTVMDQRQVELFVESLPNVQSSEAYGYRFYFYGDDHRMPFLTMANSDSEYDNRSNLSREGVFRVNLGVRAETFRKMFPGGDVDVEALDYTQLNQFLPHPDYWRQSFLCILSPAGPNVARLEQLIREAHEVSQGRYERRSSSESGA